MADSQPRLSPRRKAFADAYLGRARFNAAKAARMAGYSPAAADREGYRQLRNAEVAAYVKAQLESRAMSEEAVLAELADVAGAEWRDFLSERSDLNGGTEVKMDLSAKVKSLEILAKAHKLLTDKVQHSGSIDIRRELVGVDPEEL